jgi:hypothetical protein
MKPTTIGHVRTVQNADHACVRARLARGYDLSAGSRLLA